jgi:hypothetical protein
MKNNTIFSDMTPFSPVEVHRRFRESNATISGTKSKGEGTPRKLATAVSENCYQTELNTWNWMERLVLRKRHSNCLILLCSIKFHVFKLVW